MSKPHSNPQKTLWMERLIGRSREALRRMNFAHNGVKWSDGWMIGLVVCALLVGVISLAALGREGSAKKEGASERESSNATAKAEAVPAKASGSHRKTGVTSKSGNGGTAKSAEKENPVEKTGDGKKEHDAASPQDPAATQAITAADGGEQEGDEFLRKRAEWFYQQRAYPLKRIPPGMRQRALEHLDRMIESQRLRAGFSNNFDTSGAMAAAQLSPGASAAAAITFPGPSTWTQIGPQPIVAGSNNLSGRVTAIAPDLKNPNIVFLGAAEGGVWKTADGGATWSPLTDNQPSLATSTVAIDPNTCGGASCMTIYAGTGEEDFSIDSYSGAGILKSIDGGNSWSLACSTPGATCPFIGNAFGTRVGAIAVQPGNGSVVLAAMTNFTFSGGGIFRSTDSGATWTQVIPGIAGTQVVFDPATSTNAYAAMGYPFASTNNGIFKSTDGGVTFGTPLGGGLPTANVGRVALAFDPQTTGSNAVVYAAIADASTGSTTLLGVFKTSNGGANWTKLTGVPDFCKSQCWYDIVFAVDPANSNTLFAAGSATANGTLIRSTDGGGTWASVAGGPTPLHVDHHAMSFFSGTMYAGNDGGIWKSTNYTAATAAGSVVWTPLNSTLAITQFYPGHAVNPSNENDAFGGTQDNGMEQFSGSLSWTVNTCGDGGSAAYDRNTPTNVYVNCTSLNPPYIRKSVLGGAAGTFIGAVNGINPADLSRTPFIPQIGIDRNNPATLYTGTYRVYQSTDGASTWTPISPDLSANGLSAIVTGGLSNSNSDVVYIGTGDGQIWRTTNATAGVGAVWTNLTKAPLPPRSITSISVNGSDPNNVFVAYSGFSGFADQNGHVFESTDGGNTWTDVSCHVASCGTPGVNDLANIPVNLVAFADKINTIIVGTDIGVFDSSDGGATWSPLGTGLPRVVVLGADAGRRSGIVHAATHGRSVWALQLPGFAPGPGPFLSSMKLAFAAAGAGATLITLDGANFLSGTSVVEWDGATNGILTTFVSGNQLTATIPSTLLGSPGTHSVTVFDATQTPTTSKQLTFVVVGPAPALFSISPTSGNANTPVSITASGSGFAAGASLVFNGHLVSASSLSPTSLTATVPAGLVNFEGGVFVDVSNPGPGGGVSGFPPTFTINSAAPTISSLTPNSVNVGGPNFNLLITGTNYFTNSKVNVAGASRVTNYVSSTQLLAQILSTDIAAVGSVPITVTNPISGTSVGMSLTVAGGTNLVPTISSLSPPSVAAATNFTLTVNGANYVGSSVVQVAGAPRPTTFVSATQLTTNVSSSEVATPGLVAITVFNPAPGGGTSAASNLTVNNGVPTITSLSPANIAPAGTPGGPLTVNGTNFGSNSTVNFNGNARSTTAVNSTQVIAALLTSDLASAGVFPVTVTNSGTGGGTSGAVSFTVTGTGTAANVTLAPSPVAFANQRINTTSATTTVTLSNTGGTSVTLAASNAVTITGTNAGDFAIVAATGTNCANGLVVAATNGTCVIGVTFKPTATGARTATLQANDDATPGTQSVTLNGTGTAPTAGVAPTNIPFGNQRKGTTSAGTDVTVSNTGTDTLNIASIALGGTNPTQFVLGAPSSGTACSIAAGTAVAAASNCKFSVKFAPTATGAQAANVTVTDVSSGTAGTTQTVTLTGTGTLPQASAAPNPLAFGNQRKGTTSAALTVTLTNTGTDTLNLAAANAVVISGANAGDFAIVAGTTTCKNSTTVSPAPGPGNSCVINVTFTPSTTGAEAATLTITDDSGGVAGTTQAVSLTGTGVSPQGGAAPPTLAFGNQPKGVTSAALTATLTNSGSDTLSLAASNAVAISGANATDFAIVAGTTTCKNSTAVPPAPGPGNSCVINVTFTPSTTAAEAATLTITDDSGGVAGTTQIVSLTGTGTSVTVALTPSPEPFGNQRVGTTSAPLTITLTNGGTASVTLAAANAVALSGGNVADFAITGGTCAASLVLTAGPGPGNTCTVTAAFTPSALGPETTTLTVTFQGGTPAATDNLMGTGVFPQATPLPSTVNFNNQVINTTSGAMTVTLTNGGTDVLHLAALNAAVLGGANAGDFAVVAGTTCINGATVNPGANCVINLTFTPSALNARTATLTITDDASPTTQVATLNGTGTNPAPVITTLSPTSATAGGAAFTLTLNGTGFVNGAVVNFNGAAKTTAFVSATQVTAAILAADIATAATVNVTVTNQIGRASCR